MEKVSTIDEKQMKPEEENQDLTSMCQKIDQFLTATANPATAVDRITTFVEEEMDNPSKNHEVSLLQAIEKLSKLTNVVEASRSSNTTRALTVLQRAMTSLEEEFRTLLEDDDNHLKTYDGAEPSTSGYKEVRADSSNVVERLRRIASTMIAAGYGTECSQAFTIARREKLSSSLIEVGFLKITIEELHKMQWEELELELVAWTTTFRRIVTVSLPEERLLCDAIFSDHPTVSTGLFSNLTRGVIIQLLNFVDVATMTKKSGEKLFKFLDMYETMRDLIPVIDELFPVATEKQEEEKDVSFPSSLLQAELKSEMSVAKSRIRETIFEMFDLENSLRSESTKIPVPGGAIHPVTRYVVNYLKFVLEYTNSMVQVFQEHGLENTKDGDENESSGKTENQSKPFAAKLRTIMDLLDDTIDSKSRLYKDQSLRPIFLMNNARYILHKLKDCLEIKGLLGDHWYRKISSDIQQNHKTYKRDTWQKVIHCLREEGLHVKGTSNNVSKPVLKERLKSFNLIFEEIIKTQSIWIINDEQLRSELRVSVQAVVVPAYRSFVGRYQQNLDPGRQTHKYIKYAAEDVESYIDELFEGKPSSIMKKR